MSLLGFAWESPEILDRIEELMGPWDQSPKAESASLSRVDCLLEEKHAVAPYTPPWWPQSESESQSQDYHRVASKREYRADGRYREHIPKATRQCNHGRRYGRSTEAEASEYYGKAS